MFRDRDGWRVQWTNRLTGERQSQKFDSKGAARLFEAELKQGLRSKAPAASLTFAEFADRWLEDYCKPEKAESQWSTDESAIRVHMKPVLGHMRLGQIKAAPLEAFRRQLRAKVNQRTKRALSPKTVNLVLSLLKKMLKTAVKWGLIGESPAEGMELYSQPERAVKYWTIEERDRFLRFARNIDPDFADLCLVAAYTGLRRGELAGLQRHQVMFDQGVIQVDAVYCFRSKQRIERTKNRKIGWVPMTAEVRAALADRQLAATTSPIFPLVLFKDALGQLHGLAKAAGVRKIRFHDLRHTYASALVSQGVDLYRVQKLMRHETAAMTQRYAHLAISDLQEAADRISNARSPAREDLKNESN